MSQRKSISAESRLLIDLKEWMKCKDEFACINAAPLEKNIFEWHCNICPNSGDYKDVVFHLIIRFDKKSYPMVAPQIELCTRISHSNVFGKWICFDMIKRGWKCCYSITSILMQLESFFLFEESNVGRQRLFDRVQFEYEEMPRIRKFVCNKNCGHCWDKPFPVTQSMSGDYYYKNNKKNKVGRRSGGSGPIAVKNNKNSKNSKKNFCFLDTIYIDLEKSIIEFLNIVDLMKLKSVGKRFGYLANNSKIIQKDGIKCWFHRSIILPRSKEFEEDSMLCLGYGVSPFFYENNNNGNKSSKLIGQLFGSSRSDDIKNSIGNLEIISKISTTFDLLSSDAFVNFNIRQSTFNKRTFTHFIPIYLNNKHGNKAMQEMDDFVLKLWSNKTNNNGKKRRNKKNKLTQCHPWLKLYTIANMMKSLIVSVMQASENKNGELSLNYCNKIMEIFFRLHHTLIGIYYYHSKEISKLLQKQLNRFFDCKTNDDKYKYRNKTFIPDFGVFLSYLTLWKNKENRNWQEIGNELLDETFTRQVKLILNSHDELIDENYCSLKERVLFCWKTNKVSNRLFMFHCFFLRHCCYFLGNGCHTSLKHQFNSYNENFSFHYDNNTLAYKLQKFVNRIHNNVNDFHAFFNVIGLKYDGIKKLGLWFLNCMNESEYRGYHKNYVYFSNIKKKRILKIGDNKKTSKKMREKYYLESQKEWLSKQLKERKEMKEEFDETKKQLKIKKQEKQRQRQREQSLLYQRQQQQQQQTAKEKKHKNSKNKSKKSTKEIKVLFSWSVISNFSHISPLDNVTEILLNSRRRYPYVRVYVEIVSNKNEVLSLDEMYFDEYLNDNFEIHSGKSYPDKSIDGNISINVKKSACGKKYYADFSKRSLCYRFEENDNIIRARIKGRRVDGTTFECCQPSNWIELLNQRNENLKILQIEKEIHAAKEQLRKEDMKIKQQQQQSQQQKRQQRKQKPKQQKQEERQQRQRQGQVQRQIVLAVEENKQQTLIRRERKREFQVMTLGEEQKEKQKQRQIVEDVYTNENKIGNGLKSRSQELSRHSHQQQQQHYFGEPQQVKFLLVPMMQSVDGHQAQQVQQGQLMQSVQQIYQMAPISQMIGNNFVANGVSMMNGNSLNGYNNNNNNNNSSSVNTASNSVLSSFDNVSNGFYYDDCGTNSTSYQSYQSVGNSNSNSHSNSNSNSNYYGTNNNYNLNEYDIRNEDNNKRHEK